MSEMRDNREGLLDNRKRKFERRSQNNVYFYNNGQVPSLSDSVIRQMFLKVPPFEGEWRLLGRGFGSSSYSWRKWPEDINLNYYDRFVTLGNPRFNKYIRRKILENLESEEQAQTFINETKNFVSTDLTPKIRKRLRDVESELYDPWETEEEFL